MLPEQVDTFLDLCETGSFNRTAERMGVTQSTVSGRVAALEKFLDQKLFRRSRAGCFLTTEGLQFQPHARLLQRTLTQARLTARSAGQFPVTVRLGLQNDLAAGDPTRWVTFVREVAPNAALLIEADFSAQMSRDVQSGVLDLALLFTQYPHPDLHFETLGELPYVMVAPAGSDLRRLSDVTPDRYVFARIAPAFERLHADRLPALSDAPLAAGQGAIVQGLILRLNMAGYQDIHVATRLIAEGRAHKIEGAPTLSQPIHGVVHYINRPRRMWRRLFTTLRKALEATPHDP